MTLPAKDCYNLIRMPLSQGEDTHTVNALLLVLEDHGFIFCCRVELEDDLEEKVVARKLVPVVFIHPEQIHLGQRFVAGFVMIIDGTSNTNALRPPFLAAVGVAFSYYSSESEEVLVSS
jgi:hypothetical protein